MVLTEELQTDIYPIVSLENTNAVNFENTYYKVDPVNIVDRSAAFGLTENYPNNNGLATNNANITGTNNSQKLYRLHGNGTKMGLGITLRVMAGDKVDIYGKSYWKTADGNVPGSAASIPLLDLLTNFIGAGISGKTGVTGEMLSIAPGVMSLIDTLFKTKDQTTTQPKAYINWILFDENFRPVKNSTNSGFDAVGANGVLKSHVKNTGEIIKNGYLYIYCSNESKLDVFFDNLQVVHTRGALLEETHYYPFGLTMAGISSKAAGKLDNKYKYNGIEHNNDFDLNMYDAFYRNLDPQTGRFWQIDPKIESAEAWSPYSAMLNNPIRFSDPLGDSAIKPGYWQGVAAGFTGFFSGVGNKIKNNFNNPVQTIKDGLNPLNQLKALVQMLPVSQIVDDTKTAISIVDNLAKGNNFEAGKIGGEKAGEATLSGGVMILTWGVGKGISLGQVKSGLGDLTKAEVKSIQKAVNEAERPIEIAGSAANGTRRGVGTSDPIGKGQGTKSDIDYLASPGSIPYFNQTKLPSIDPKSGIIPGLGNPFQGPLIKFEPGAKPTFIPKSN